MEELCAAMNVSLWNYFLTKFTRLTGPSLPAASHFTGFLFGWLVTRSVGCKMSDMFKKSCKVLQIDFP